MHFLEVILCKRVTKILKVDNFTLPFLEIIASL